MKRQRASSYTLTWTLIGVVTLGIALSIALTPDTRWMSWHLSRLGEGGSLAAAVFNFTFILAALILVKLASRIMSELSTPGAHRLRALFFCVAVCWLGIGSFPFDQFPIIHNIFGYGQFLLIGYMMLRLRHICRCFSERTYTIGVGVAILTALLLTFFHITHFTTLLVVEIIGQLGVYGWLLSMAGDARRTCSEKSV
jgi:hypothetical membrane protein